MTKADWSQVRGFNWMPSWAPLLYEAWTQFDADQAARELSAALKYGANTIRVWWDWHAWRLRPQRSMSAFAACLDVAADLELRVMPTLFNRWVDGLYPAGGLALDHFAPPQSDWAIFEEYVDAVVGRWANDERVIAWDVCNQPLQRTIPITLTGDENGRGRCVLDGAPGWSRKQPLQAREIDFMVAMIERARAAGPVQPMTIGTIVGDNVRVFERYVDVISFHPYADTAEGMALLCDDHLALAEEAGKPIVATETCKGSLNDSRHVDMAMWSIEALESQGIGWLLWQLSAGQMVAARPDWYHGNTPPNDSGYMAFALPDGSLRPGHERLVEWLEARG
jgi:endo-1,4-beta-mannosidase